MSDVIGIIGLGVTVLGFGLTIWQLWRTANASEESTRALKAATRRMNLNHLLVLLPQLRMYETELDAAQTADDESAAIRALVAYSHTATQVAALLESASDSEEEKALIEKLRESATSASAAKSALVTGSAKPLKQVVKQASMQISSMTRYAAGLTTHYQSNVG